MRFREAAVRANSESRARGATKASRTDCRCSLLAYGLTTLRMTRAGPPAIAVGHALDLAAVEADVFESAVVEAV